MARRRARFSAQNERGPITRLAAAWRQQQEVHGACRLYQGSWVLGPILPRQVHAGGLGIAPAADAGQEQKAWRLRWVDASSASRVLAPIVGSDVQFVRFHDLRGKPYFGMNVLRVERGFLDVERSQCDRRSDGDIAFCSQYVFKKDLPADLPPIFKISPGSNVLVTQRFAEALIEHKLTGFCLQDPGQDAIRLMAKGLPLNAYPGLL